MKIFFRVILLAVSVSSALASSDDSAVVLRAEQRRIHAIMTRDAVELRELLSDDLYYAHADGRVQNKAQLLAALSSPDLNHLSVEPERVKYQSIADGAGIVTGQAKIVVETNGRRVVFTLQYLAVWRNEGGQWRLVAYQSSQPSPTAAGATK